MFLSPLQFIFIISGLVFFLFAIDSFQRKRFNWLHFLVFFWWTFLIILFSFDSTLLNKFWSFFWLNRWADLLVYISIILLAYFYFEILNKATKQTFLTTRIITEQSIQKALSHWELSNLKLNEGKLSEYVFLIRSYNEWKTLPNVIDEIFDYGFSKILVVNDWSVDNTVRLILEKKEKHKDKDLILISHLINRWWWAANKTGFEFLKRYWDQLKAKWIVTFDADLQMDISDMKTFIWEINKNKSIYVFLWSRFIDWWSASNIPTFRKFILFWSRIITYLFNWLWIIDPHNWYRVISLESLKKIQIDSDGMMYASELLDEIRGLELNYKEVPVNIRYTEYSLGKWQKNGNAFKILMELIYKKFFYK